MKKTVLAIIVVGLMMSLQIVSFGASQSTRETAFSVRCINTGNQPPSTPEVEGPINGDVGTQYNYDATSYDPDGNDIQYKFYWGDGTESEWSPSYPSGETCRMSHTWNVAGTYTVSVKARDIPYHAESDLGTLEVTMPMNNQQCSQGAQQYTSSTVSSQQQSVQGSQQSASQQTQNSQGSPSNN